MPALSQLKHHAQFYVALLIGLAVWGVAYGGSDAMRALAGADSFFVAHILAMGLLVRTGSHETFRKRAQIGDEGTLIITLIVVATLVLSLGSIFALLNHKAAATVFTFVLALASAPLGWAMLHMVFAFHYAKAWYGDREGDGKADHGIAFPGDQKQPQAWDFLYYSFVVGMTAQVSDATVTTTRMRRLTLAHSVMSFFYNTVIVAIAVNVAVLLATKD